jgi:hypothetical protein
MDPYIMVRQRRALVNVVGKVWMGGKAATTYQLSDQDLESIGEFTRDKVEGWLKTHAGDFQQIDDFEAFCGSEEIQWENEENEGVCSSRYDW